MTLTERIADGVRDLPTRAQVEIMNHVFRLNPRLQREQDEMLQRTHDAWIEDDEPSVGHLPEGNRRVEGNG